MTEEEVLNLLPFLRAGYGVDQYLLWAPRTQPIPTLLFVPLDLSADPCRAPEGCLFLPTDRPSPSLPLGKLVHTYIFDLTSGVQGFSIILGR